MQHLTEEEFDDRFTVVPNAEGQLLRDVMPGDDPTSRTLWTVVEADSGEDLYAVPGLRYVNRVGYLLTEEEWTDDIESAEWHVGGTDD